MDGIEDMAMLEGLGTTGGPPKGNNGADGGAGGVGVGPCCTGFDCCKLRLWGQGGHVIVTR